MATRTTLSATAATTGGVAAIIVAWVWNGFGPKDVPMDTEVAAAIGAALTFLVGRLMSVFGKDAV